ncbi:MAG: HNH endonuclease [Gammaproteobacteria bacterium]|nr:HNH endonuclease [Gammaproteobacteria bacterium]
MKGVFSALPDTHYDDDVGERYHVPNRLLREAQKCIDDWIVYYEPRRAGGRQAYVAVARVTRIATDPADPGSSYAYVADYLPFDVVVPLRRGSGYWENRLNALEKRSLVGRELQDKSIRTVSDSDFGAITVAGLSRTLDPGPAHVHKHGGTEGDETVQSLIEAPREEQERRIVAMLANRPFRDRAFRTRVVDAYEETCAVTGLRIINGGGNAEVQAAHIWPVDDGGPDIVQNGIALSATCHWLFDRHLISLSDDYGLLVSHNRVPTEFRNLFEKQVDRIHLPADERLWPRPEFVTRHRERFAGHGP